MTLIVTVKVVPSSGRQAWTVDRVGNLKCYLKNPAKNGKANEELIKRMSKALGIARHEIAIISGTTSRTKLIKINADIKQIILFKALGIAHQQSFLLNSS